MLYTVWFVHINPKLRKQQSVAAITNINEMINELTHIPVRLLHANCHRCLTIDKTRVDHSLRSANRLKELTFELWFALIKQQTNDQSNTYRHYLIH